MSVEVLDWGSRHREGLDRALGAPDELCSQARPFFGPPVDGPWWRFTLVAEMGDDPVGAAVAFVSHWHPHRLWVSVEVAAERRRQEVGTALLEAVRERCRADGRPLRGKVFADTPAAAFAARHGFKVIQRSRTFRLHEPASLASVDLTIEAPAAPTAIAAAFRDFYVSSHDWDPPGPITLDDISKVHLTDATLAIVVRGPSGEPLAAGCLFDEDGVLSFSGGPTDPTEPRAAAACAALLDAVPRPVLVEADDSVPAMLAALTARTATVTDEVHLVAEA